MAVQSRSSTPDNVARNQRPKPPPNPRPSKLNGNGRVHQPLTPPTVYARLVFTEGLGDNGENSTDQPSQPMMV